MRKSRVTLLHLGLTGLLTGLHCYSPAQQVQVQYNTGTTYQTIRNFSASDAWSCQFTGNWPDAKKNAMADWLFSMDTLGDGSPKGIGLSLWRMNIGAGSTQQGANSGIRDEWRRASALALDGTPESAEVKAQLWFMQAARSRGVEQFLGFYNSPPVQLTRNGKAFATNKVTNIDSTQYSAFAAQAVKAVQHIKTATGITLDYLSPINEPQWDWSDGGQEGSPYYNREISGVFKAMHTAFKSNGLTTKLLVGEAGSHKYMLPNSDRPGKDDQVKAFFQKNPTTYLGNLNTISRTIASHSYFSTSPAAEAIDLRKRVAAQVAGVKGLEFWQSEYCILGDNAGEIDGNKKDTGITAALYVAGVIHKDLVYANAAAWQWWIAISAYDYKDGLIYIDQKKEDGNYSDSKMLWALGNYSRFVRPGMRRFEVATTGNVQASGFAGAGNKELVFVLVNAGNEAQQVSLVNARGNKNTSAVPVTTYTTSAAGKLLKGSATAANTTIPAKSIVTVILQTKKK